MVINVNDNSPNAAKPGNYKLEIPDDKIIDGITSGSVNGYWYVLIDGKIFKSDMDRGLKSFLFSSKEIAESRLMNALYWRDKLIPNIGRNCGYDVNDFYEKLISTHDVEFKQLNLLDYMDFPAIFASQTDNDND